MTARPITAKRSRIAGHVSILFAKNVRQNAEWARVDARTDITTAHVRAFAAGAVALADAEDARVAAAAVVARRLARQIARKKGQTP